MENTMKIIKSFEGSGVLIKSICKTKENKSKEQEDGFIRRLLVKLGATLLRNLLAGKV